MKKATVAICTAGRRHEMLKRCIDSLMKVTIPAGWNIDFLLVMNTECDLTKTDLLGYTILWQNVHYIHEPRPGLSIARNCAIDYCIAHNREWLIFIDDDTWVPDDWLIHFIEMVRRWGAVVLTFNIFQGCITYLYGDNIPLWIKKKRKVPKNGSDLRGACTNNVMIHRSIFRKQRFDEAYNYTGGEDTDFFIRALSAGERIIYCADANIYEEVPKERRTFKAYLWRSYWCSSVNMYSLMRRGGGAAVIKKVPKIAQRFITGLLLITLSPLCIVCGKNRAFLIAARGIDKLTFVAGSIVGLTPWRPLPYKFKKDKDAI